MSDKLYVPPAPKIDTLEKSQLVVDTSDWRMRDYKRWMKVANDNDIDGLNEMMLRAIKTMPDGSEPSADALDDLHPSEWFEIGQVISKSFRKAD